jgi:hypothetical protein
LSDGRPIPGLDIDQQLHQAFREVTMRNFLPISIVAMIAALAVPGSGLAQGAAASNVAGTYRCQPEPDKCQAQTYTLSQTGNNLEIKSAEGGVIAAAKLTSNITISAGPTWNSLGRILPDRSIEWTNGTKWVKQ